MQPLLSFVIPTRNRADFLERLLGSLRRQLAGVAPGSVEVVVLDNASTDRTPAVCAEVFGAGGGLPAPDFRYVRNPVDVGADVNMLLCPGVASGRWLWIFGDDDTLHEGTLTRVVALLQRTDAGMVLLNYRQWDRTETTILAERILQLDQDQEFPTLGEWLRQPASLATLLFISSAIGLREPMAAIDPEPYRIGSLFGFLGVRLEGLGDRPALVVAEPWITQRQLAGDTSPSDGGGILGKATVGIAILQLLLRIGQRSRIPSDALWAASIVDGIGDGRPSIDFLDYVTKNLVIDSLAGSLMRMTRDEWTTITDFCHNESQGLPVHTRNRLFAAVNAAIEAHNAMIRLMSA